MSHQHIHFDMIFNCSPTYLFQQLTDHVNFGHLVSANIVRIKDGPENEPNGVGSIRKITLIPGLAFEETVQRYEPPLLMEYQITRGSPIKEHWGRLSFSPTDAGCRLIYTIDFKGKIPGTGWLIKPFIENPIRRGLTQLQKTLVQTPA